MKIFFPALFVCFSFCVMQSQPVLNGTNMPVHGTKVYTASASNTIPANVIAGAPGINQTWNFSNLVAEINDSIMFYSADSTAYNIFQTATLATGDTNAYTYYRNDAGGFYQMGDVGDFYNSGQVCQIVSTPPYRLMQWPSTYGQMYSDSFEYVLLPCNTSSTTNDSIAYHIYYTNTSEADAWGTMQLPGGTFSCIRYKRTFTYIDTIWSYYNGNPWTVLATVNGSSVHYEWWSDSPSINFTLVTLVMDTVNNVAANVEWIEANGTTTAIQEKMSLQCNVSPNPSSGKIAVQLENSDVYQLGIFNHFGNAVRFFENVRSGDEFDTNLPAGIYFCRFTGVSGKSGLARLVIIK